MKLKQIAKYLKWTAVWTATWTMLMTPVAWGRQAMNVSKQEMQNMITELGLNRRITMGEFFEKNRHLFSERVLKEVEPFFIENRNMRMPQIEVVTVKSGLGENITTLRITDSNGQLNNVQWFGETKRLVKFQGTTLSQTDVANFDDMFKHLLQQDPSLQKQAMKSHNEAEAISKFESINMAFPSKKEWKAMSLENRSAYIVSLRRLLSQAKEVNSIWLNKLNEKNNFKSKPKKTSSIFLEKINFVRSLIAGHAAEATADFTSCPVGEPCIIAGYTSAYANRSGRCSCDLPAIGQRFDNLDYKVYPVADRICKGEVGHDRAIACNPYLYMRENGTPICIDTRTPVISNATTYEGLCDQQSRMSSERLEVVENEIDEGRYSVGNLKDDIEERARAAQGPNFEATKNFLRGTLTFIQNNRGEIYGANPAIAGVDIEQELGSGPISEVVHNQLLITHRTFQTEIGNARRACVSAARDGWHEPQFYNACDQLHARYIFIKDFLKTKCAAGQEINDELKCSCPGGAASVLPGVTCGPPNPPVDPQRPVDRPGGDGDAADAIDCNRQFPDANAVFTGGRCVCPGTNQVPTVRATGAGGGQSFTCGGSIDNRNDDRDRGRCADRGLFCRLWQGIKTIFPYVVTGVVIYALFKMMAPKKPGLTNPQDPCPDGSMAPCTTRTCPNPDHRWIEAVQQCMCPNSCVTGVLDPVTCGCSGTGGTGGTGNTSITLTCPDSLSTVSCPVGTPFTDCISSGCTAHCVRNGTPVYDPMVCSSSQAPTTSTPSTNSTPAPINGGSGR
jgi:hypothetical protein